MRIDQNYLKQILKEAGTLLDQYFGSGAIVTTKRYRDILIEADLASDRFITSRLQKKYPDILLLSEETIDRPRVNTAEYRFILDPLDGTINFSRGIGEFGISLAVQQHKKTILGLVYKPREKAFYEASCGEGSYYREERLQVSRVRSLDQAVVAIDVSRERSVVPQYVNALHSNIRAFRSYGCAVQALGYIVRGNVDAYLYDTPKIWDIAAMECIIKEAGGLVLDQNGRPWRDGEPLCICTPSIRKELFACLNI